MEKWYVSHCRNYLLNNSIKYCKLCTYPHAYDTMEEAEKAAEALRQSDIYFFGESILDEYDYCIECREVKENV